MKDYQYFISKISHLVETETGNSGNSAQLFTLLKRELKANQLDTIEMIPAWFNTCIYRLLDKTWEGVECENLHPINQGDVFSFIADLCSILDLPSTDDGEIKTILFPNIKKSLTFYFEGDKYEIKKLLN